MKIYIAAAKSRAGVAQRLKAIIERAGHVVVSQWHGLILGAEKLIGDDAFNDPEEDNGRLAILGDNIRDIEASEALIVLAYEGEPSATFCEVGYAVASHKPVCWAHGPRGEGRNLFDAHPLVTRITFDVYGVDAMIAWLEERAQ